MTKMHIMTFRVRQLPSRNERYPIGYPSDGHIRIASLALYAPFLVLGHPNMAVDIAHRCERVVPSAKSALEAPIITALRPATSIEFGHGSD
jgi:hypothetical protein